MSDLRLRRLRLLIWLTAGLLVAVVASVMWRAYPSTEAVRLRNSLLLQTGPEVPGDWTPQNVPPSFKTERMSVPEPISAAAHDIKAKVGNDDDLALAKALAGYLNGLALKGGRIDSFDVGRTYEILVAEGRGYCADVVDVYIALANSVGLFVRPWSFSFDGFGGHGHINVEIFDRSRGVWVMLDVFNNVVAIDRATGQPLSAQDFRVAFGRDKRSVLFVPIGEGRQRIPVYEKLVAYYERGIDQWYLRNGNNVVGRAASPIVKLADRLGEPLAELAALALGTSARLLPMASATNRDKLDAMFALRLQLLASLYVAIALALILLLEIGLLYAWLRVSRSQLVSRVQPAPMAKS